MYLLWLPGYRRNESNAEGAEEDYESMYLN